MSARPSPQKTRHFEDLSDSRTTSLRFPTVYGKGGFKSMQPIHRWVSLHFSEI
jgi:nucleoside-diphosphate-sugar epimerase